MDGGMVFTAAVPVAVGLVGWRARALTGMATVIGVLIGVSHMHAGPGAAAALAAFFLLGWVAA